MDCREIVLLLTSLVVTKPYFRKCVKVVNLLNSVSPQFVISGENNIFVVLCENRGHQSSNDNIGHFVLIFISCTGNVYLFDSSGNADETANSYPQIKQFIDKVSSGTQLFNKKRIQSFNSCACGIYCIFVAIYLSLNYSLQTILSWFSDTDLVGNDLSILKWFKKRIGTQLVQDKRILLCDFEQNAI